ncbi:hypothetical protein Tco_0180353 [Tanacetum coccineum]
MMSFLTSVVTIPISNYQHSAKELRQTPSSTSTIYDGKVNWEVILLRPVLKPKEKEDETWFNDKVLLVQAQASAKIALKRRILSRNGSDALTEVHNPDNLTYDLINQSEQIMTSSEQSNDVNQTETEITSDSNIIPYSQYLSETQQETVQNSNSSAQQDCLELKIELLNKKDVVDKETYDKSLSKTSASGRPHPQPSQAIPGMIDSANTSSNFKKNKVEAHSRTLNSSLE